jgi:hypothetical protein
MPRLPRPRSLVFGVRLTPVEHAALTALARTLETDRSTVARRFISDGLRRAARRADRAPA